MRVGQGTCPTLTRGRRYRAAPKKIAQDRLDPRPRLDDMAFERITVDPARMGGVPTVRDTRVTVSMVLGQLSAGRTIDEVVADYPYLERDDVLAALEYAAAAVNEREVPVARPA